MSQVIFHAPHVTCHISYVIFFWTKGLSYSMEGLSSKRPTLFTLPLIFNTVLYFTVLFRIQYSALHCAALYSTAPHCTGQQCPVQFLPIAITRAINPPFTDSIPRQTNWGLLKSCQTGDQWEYVSSPLYVLPNAEG